MQIREVRESIQDYSSEQLRLIIGELYKLVPKRVIKEKEIDDLIKNPQVFVDNRKKNPKTVVLPDFDDVSSETKQFIEDAKQQYYFAPNRIISKKDHPKRRFIAKRLYKSLLALTADPENLAEVTDLLEKLYCLLCEACGVYLFSSDDPFSSAGIEQKEFYRQVIAAKRLVLPPAEWIRAGIRLVVENETDRNILRTDLMYVLMEFLTTAPLREQAVEHGDRLRPEYSKSLGNKRGGRDYAGERRFNDVVQMVLILQMALAEHEEAIRYFKAYYIESNKEISLYVLLKWLSRCGLIDLWLREYEVALQQGIKPREGLMEAYRIIKGTGELTKYM